MAEYSKEFSKMKGLAANQLKDMIAGIKAGTIKMSGNEPKMSYRALRSLLLSEDKTHQALVEDLLSGKLNIEKFKNKIRGNIERVLPNKVRILDTDRIHHKTPLEFGEILSEMPDEDLRQFLTQQYEQHGRTYGDSDSNTRGSSFDERAHTGARPKASKSKIVYPNTEGPEGLREVSAHPRGTRDKAYNIPDRPKTAKDAASVAEPLLKQADNDFKLGVQADTSRRNYVNDQLVKQGIIKQGDDIFSSTVSDDLLQRARPVLKSAELQKGAARAFTTPKPTFLSGKAMFSAPIAMLAEFLPAIDEITGGHITGATPEKSVAELNDKIANAKVATSQKGRMCLKNGAVCLKDFGVSELIGLNRRL